MITSPDWPNEPATLSLDEFLAQAPEKLHFIANDRAGMPPGTCFMPAQLFSLALTGFGFFLSVPLTLVCGNTLLQIIEDTLTGEAAWRDVALQCVLAAGVGGVSAYVVVGLSLLLVDHLRHLAGRYKVGLYLLDDVIAWRDAMGMIFVLPRSRLARMVISPGTRHQSPQGTWFRHQITVETMEGEPWTVVFDRSLPSWLALRRLRRWLDDHQVETG